MHPDIFLLFRCAEAHVLLVAARSFSEILMLDILTSIPIFVFILMLLLLYGKNLFGHFEIRNELEIVLDSRLVELAFSCFIFTLGYLLTILRSQNLEELKSITKMYQVYLEVNLVHLLLLLYHFHFWAVNFSNFML